MKENKTISANLSSHSFFLFVLILFHGFFYFFSSSSVQPKHQVFLSFRGEDTRLSFTSSLLQALKDKGINVFIDEEKLEMGWKLSQALLTAIAESKIAIVILSQQYASSSFCLEELFQIMDRSAKELLELVPIFYHIDPSDVRNVGGNFKISFDEHKRKKRPAQDIQRWKHSFAKVGHLVGRQITGGRFDRSEASHIKTIVEDVIKKLNSKSSIASEELVGIDAHKEKILKLIHRNDTRVIGICGMGGLGKTTLAKAVYKEVPSQFIDHLMLLNVREKFEKQGMEDVVNDFLRRVLKQDTRIDIPSSDVIMDRLLSKRVFLVLDDVNDSDQIEDLGVRHLGPGSKIIVTSRDQQVLRIIDAKIYSLPLLNKDDSLKLICKFAFKQDHPITDFWDISVKLANCAGGLPLALKLLGSALYQKPKEDWESLIVKLKEYPEGKVLKTLKISFDALDRLERNVFLDIACFFKGRNREDATNTLDCCYNKSARSVITILVDKCLLEISRDGFDLFNTLWMHDLLQEMGWEIIRLESEDPRKRSRLWRSNDICLLEDDKVTDSVKAVFFDLAECPRNFELQICPAAFEKMTNLRLIMFCNLSVASTVSMVLKPDMKFLSDELRYLHWDGYPLKSLPSTFNPKNLVELRLAYSKIELLWGGDKDLVNLRVLYLFFCTNLRKIQNLSRAIKLEELWCCRCWNLIELPCMEHLTSLKRLELKGCSNLKSFPEAPIQLKRLNLARTGIQEVPDSIGHLSHLREVFLDGTRIEKVPSSISCLDKLEILNISNTRIQNLPSNIVELHALKEIRLDSCPNITIFPNFPEKIEEITMRGSSIEEIPSSISRLKSLKLLILDNSQRLKSLNELPPFTQEIQAPCCRSLQMVSFADPDEYTFCKENGRHRIVFGISKLNKDAIDNIVANALLRIHRITEQLVEKSTVELVKEWEEKELDGKIYRISNYGEEFRCVFTRCLINLELFEHQSSDSSTTVELDSDKSSSSLLGFVFGILYDQNENRDFIPGNLVCKWQLKTTSGECHNFMLSVPVNKYRKQDILFDRIMVHEAMPYVEASFQFDMEYDEDFERKERHDFKVKKYGVHVFYTDANRNMGRNIHLRDGAECSEIFHTEEDGRNISPDNGHEPETNEMKIIYCFPIEGLLRLLQNVCSLFKGKVEQTEDV